MNPVDEHRFLMKRKTNQPKEKHNNMIIKHAHTDTEWENPKPGIHNAVLVDVIDKGITTREFNGETKQSPTIRLVWELESKASNGNPLLAGRTLTLSLAPRSNLRGMLRTWLGRDLNGQELQEFDLDELIGRSAQVLLSPYEKNGESRVFVKEVLEPLQDRQLKSSGQFIRMQDREGYLPPSPSAESTCRREMQAP